ncbi:hypothetical protein [Streptomyces sp. NPDC003393]
MGLFGKRITPEKAVADPVVEPGSAAPAASLVTPRHSCLPGAACAGPVASGLVSLLASSSASACCTHPGGACRRPDHRIIREGYVASTPVALLMLEKLSDHTGSTAA